MDLHILAPVVALQMCATILSFCLSKFEKLFPERQTRGIGKCTFTSQYIRFSNFRFIFLARARFVVEHSQVTDVILLKILWRGLTSLILSVKRSAYMLTLPTFKEK